MYLVEILGGGRHTSIETVMLYKASRDGWKKEDFHRMSDGKEFTVALFKIEEDDSCIGGTQLLSGHQPHHRL
jgi:hypothetical protein